MGFASIGGITLHDASDGVQDGPPLVFINSLGSDLRIWDEVILPFTDRFAILRFDNRGHGLSDCPPGPYVMQNFIDDLAGLLDHQHIDSAVLIGISIGGMIAMGYAAVHPEKVKGLVLCDTGTKIGTTAYWNERIDKLRQNGMDSLGDVLISRWLTPAFAQQHPTDYRGYRNMITHTPLSGYIATCEALREADLSTTAQTVAAKALVVCGSEDASTPPDLGRALASTLKDARFALIEGAAHLPCIDKSAQLAALIKDFLQELPYGG
jgi:3-oxoadipate enol-lactonase